MPDNTANKPAGGPVESLTKLLKKHNAGLSAVAANKLLLAAGILEEKLRASTKDPSKMKKFKIITALGRDYGENIANDLSPNETTPKYYVNAFEELLEKYLKK